tara:strand:+ start:319 stop:486 length:168 start_codon:yes stop_codon:yes gene_type:complete
MIRVIPFWLPLTNQILVKATVNRMRPVKHDQPTFTVTGGSNNRASLPVMGLDFHA